MRKVTCGLGVVLVATMLAGVAAGGTSAAPRTSRYIVVFKPGHSGQGVKAVKAAGGIVVRINKVGVGTVVSRRADFAARLRASGRVDGVARNAGWFQKKPKVVGVARVPMNHVPGHPAPPNVPTAGTGCAQQYMTPGGTGVGPDPLSICQWDMRIINASPTGSYAVNQGEGVTIGINDTGVDLTHQDIQPNLNVGLSCSFIRPTTPTSLPQEWETTGNACSTKSAVQDYNGHGTHVAGTAAAPINGRGVAGVAPRATIVGLKSGTAAGWFFTQEVVDSLVYAGDKRIDVVNMSFFADPFLFNCKNESEQRTIVKAISRAAQYAHERGVVLVSSAGNEETDLDHPEMDVISPDYPPDSEIEREVGNQCVVLPHELPWVLTISSIGPRKRLAFYSNWSNSKVDVTSPGGSSGQAPNPYGRVLNAWSSTAPLLSNNTRRVEDCQTVGGAPVCFQYVWIQGTSMAAPHAAGVAALIRRNHPDLPALAVGALLQNTAMPMACGGEPAADIFWFAFPGQEKRCTGTRNPGAKGSQTNFYGNGLTDAFVAGTN